MTKMRQYYIVENPGYFVEVYDYYYGPATYNNCSKEISTLELQFPGCRFLIVNRLVDIE